MMMMMTMTMSMSMMTIVTTQGRTNNIEYSTIWQSGGIQYSVFISIHNNQFFRIWWHILTHVIYKSDHQKASRPNTPFQAESQQSPQMGPYQVQLPAASATAVAPPRHAAETREALQPDPYSIADGPRTCQTGARGELPQWGKQLRDRSQMGISTCFNMFQHFSTYLELR